MRQQAGAQELSAARRPIMKRALRIYGWAKQLFQCLYVFGEGLSQKNRGWRIPSGIFPSSPLPGTNPGQYLQNPYFVTSLLPDLAPVQSLRFHPGEK